MGTNYYAHLLKCECCGRYDELHIGKSSAGWQFTFRAHDYEGASPRIKSFGDWFDLLQKRDVEIYDEYGAKMPFQEWFDMVQWKQKNETRNHAMLYPSDRDYVDPDGYSFTNSEFS